MPSYNKVILIGHLTRDIELKELPTGDPVANMAIAVNHTRSNKNGERQEEVCFIDCEAFGRTASIMAEWLGKGKAVLLEGRLRLNQWETQDGQKRSKHSVVIDKFEFIGPKSASDTASPADSDTPRAPTPDPKQSDIPF